MGPHQALDGSEDDTVSSDIPVLDSVHEEQDDSVTDSSDVHVDDLVLHWLLFEK